jgi:hypothetical protein
MCRYFNFDELITDNDPSISISPRKKSTSTPTEDGDSQIDELGPYHSLVFSVLFFFTRNREFGICQKAIISLGILTNIKHLVSCADTVVYTSGQLSASSSSILRKDVVKNMYMLLLGNEKTDFLPLRIQVLKNLSCFLHVEEEKAMQKSEKSLFFVHPENFFILYFSQEG